MFDNTNNYSNNDHPQLCNTILSSNTTYPTRPSISESFSEDIITTQIQGIVTTSIIDKLFYTVPINIDEVFKFIRYLHIVKKARELIYN